MPDKAWKAFERRIAKSLGTVRTPLSGKASRHTSSDTLHPDLYVESKTRATLVVDHWFSLVADAAKLEFKTPILALHRRGARRTLAVIDWDFFLQIYSDHIDLVNEYDSSTPDKLMVPSRQAKPRKGVTHD